MLSSDANNGNQNTRDVKSPPAHPYIAIFERVRPFDHRMMKWKFRNDISNGSGVTVLTERQTSRHPNTQTDTTENNRTVAGRVVMMGLTADDDAACL